jgi:AbrB family looped-hinge helix DNA binding protein
VNSNNNYIRKIDELGRIVIPKEVRTKLKIQENESIMITSDNSKIVISKYSYLNNYLKFISDICETFIEIYKTDIKITDREKTIFNSNINAKYLYKEDIIKNSVIIGSIELVDQKYKLLGKLIARIISSYLTIS